MDQQKFDRILEYDLTRMEERVVRLYLEGKSDSQIAKALYITERTFRSHLSNTCRKFGLSDPEENRKENRNKLILLFIKYKAEWVAPSRGGIVEYPNGKVPLNSYFYISRNELDSKCYQEIQRAGALLRIKGSQGTGKSSLVSRIVAQAENRLSYRTVEIDFTLLNLWEYHKM